MAQNIAGLFPDRASAEQAIADLKDAGFDPNHMGIVMRDRQDTREVASDQGINSTTGAVTGSAIGGTAGAILAATGAFVIPGIGPFISGGILATALAGGAAGWLIGGLVGLGFPHEEAEYYQGRVEQGSTLLTVDAPGREIEAQRIMLNNGAEDLRTQGYGYSGATPPTAAQNAAPMPPNATPQRAYPTDADIIAERNAERNQQRDVEPSGGVTREQEDQPTQTGLL